MSVPKSERGESKTEYLRQLRLLEKDLLVLCEKKPKKFLYFLRTHIEDSIANAYSNAKKGSCVNIASKADADLRRRYMYLSYCDVKNLASQIELLFDIYGTDLFTIKQIEDLSNRLHFCSKLLEEVLTNDKEIAKKLAKEDE
jgi:hypothetical protein